MESPLSKVGFQKYANEASWPPKACGNLEARGPGFAGRRRRPWALWDPLRHQP